MKGTAAADVTIIWLVVPDEENCEIFRADLLKIHWGIDTLSRTAEVSTGCRENSMRTLD